MQSKSFILYTNYHKVMSLLNVEERGLLLTALFEYTQGEVKTPLPKTVQIAFELIRNQLEVDQEKYAKIVERNRRNGVKHTGSPIKSDFSEVQPDAVQNLKWQPVGLLASQRNPNEPSGFFGMPNDNDNKNDNDNENENKNDNDNKDTGRRKGGAFIGDILPARLSSSGMIMVRAKTPPRPQAEAPPPIPKEPYVPLPPDWALPERLKILCLKSLPEVTLDGARVAYIRESNRRESRSSNPETGFISYLKRYLYETAPTLDETVERRVETLIAGLKKEVASWT